jgi:hypothetical protein
MCVCILAQGACIRPIVLRNFAYRPANQLLYVYCADAYSTHWTRPIAILFGGIVKALLVCVYAMRIRVWGR